MVSVDQLSSALSKNLKQYANGVGEDISGAAKEIMEDGLTLLRRDSPKAEGKYARGWRLKRQSNGGYILYNATSYQLTHLLEKSHALVNGGRSDPQPHIRPVEEQVVSKFLSEVEAILR
jgi:hypothetical protein